MKRSEFESDDRLDERSSRRAGWVVAAACAAGALGLLPGRAGASDPFALLAWLVLAMPGVGVLVGAARVRLWPAGVIPPAVWAFLVIEATLVSLRDLPHPALAMAVVAGLYFVGLGLGFLLAGGPRIEVAGRGYAVAGVLVLALVLASGLSVGGGLAPPDEANGARRARMTVPLLDVSPLVLAFECAGLDWTHAHPELYARSGIEWFPRAPFRGVLAAPVVLLVGSLFAFVASRRRA